MYYVSVTIILCSLPAGLGVIVDRLMLRRHKGRLHDALLQYWVNLDELSLTDIWRVFAAYTIRFFCRVFGKKFLSFRFIITLMLVSFCLTFCAIALGILLTGRGLSYLIEERGWLVVLFVNLVFDTLTGLVTVKVLSVIHRSTPGKAIALIVIDIILAFLFASLCLTSMHILFPRYISLFKIFSDNIIHISEGLLGSKIWPTSTAYDLDLMEFLYACTTFIPTLIYLTILATLIISKVILGIGIRVTKFLLERATDVDTSKDLAVFTLTGSLFSVIVLLLTVFSKLCQT